jgi:hypothetical protein
LTIRRGIADPDRCDRAYTGNTIGQANAVSDKLMDLRKCNYHGKTLSAKVLSGALVSGADFSDAILRETVMTKVFLPHLPLLQTHAQQGFCLTQHGRTHGCQAKYRGGGGFCDGISNLHLTNSAVVGFVGIWGGFPVRFLS